MAVRIDDDLLSEEAVQELHGYFRQLREEDPIHWNERHRSWVVTRYADVAALFKERRLSAERIGQLLERDDMEEAVAILARWMVFTDPPDHTRLRRVGHASFTPRVVERLAGRVQALVDELLDPIQERGDADLIADFAFPLPASVIAELLGVPVADREAFKRWSDELLALIFGELSDPERHERGKRGLFALRDYFEELIGYYEQHPGDNLTSLFLAAPAEQQLGRTELVATLILLLFAGHETTTNLIGNGLLALFDHPGQVPRLLERPDLTPLAVEELLRYDGPAKISPRWVVGDFERAGRRIRAGQRVLLVQSAANRDPERFPEPDRLDVRRRDNAHLAFGYGIHYCLGAPLARLEGRIAIPAVLRRFPNLTLAADRRSLRFHPNLLGRSLEALPVTVS